MINKETQNDVEVFNLSRAIERDFRKLIIKNIIHRCSNAEQLIRNQPRLENALRTFNKRHPNEDHNTSLELLVGCTSFGAAHDILLGHKMYLEPDLASFMKKNKKEISKIIDIRNWVFHSEPSTREHRDFLVNFASQVPKEYFQELIETATGLRESPELYQDRLDPVIFNWDKDFIHNVPYPPDYADTGFIGRASDLKKINKRLKGNTRIVTIVGEAGVGKTALAQKISIDFIVNKDYFDLILWYSFKNFELTTHGIKRIEGLTSIYQIAYENLNDIDTYHQDQDFFEWINSNNTLIILDNLEVIQGLENRPFLDDLQENAKVLITSRNRLDLPSTFHTLQPFTLGDCVDLFKRYASDKQIGKIQNANDSILEGWSKNLYKNPLWIKNFSNLVSEGQDPNFIISRLGRTDFGDYAFTTNYQTLGTTSKNLLTIIFNSIGRHITALELQQIYKYRYSEVLSPRALNRELQKLADQNFLDWNSFVKNQIVLSGLAESWLKKNSKITSQFMEVNKARSSLAGAIRSSREESSHITITDWQHFSCKNKEEEIAAAELNEAIKLLKKAQEASFYNINKEDYGEVLKGVVKNIQPYGAFVRLPDGEDGLLHNSRISSSRRLLKASDVFQEGQEIKVVVVSISKAKNKNKITLATDENFQVENPEKYIDAAIKKCNSIRPINYRFFEIDRVLALIKSYSGRAKLKREANDHYLNAIESAPEEAKTYYFYANYLGFYNPTEEKEFMKKAHELAPDDNVIATAYGRNIEDIDESIDFLLRSMKNCEIGSKAMMITVQSIFRVLIKNNVAQLRRETPISVVDRSKKVLDKFKDKMNIGYFDQKSVVVYLLFLDQFLNTAATRKRMDSKFDFSYFLSYLDMISMDISDNKIGRHRLIAFLDKIQLYFPELVSDFKELPFVSMHIDSKSLNRILGDICNIYEEQGEMKAHFIIRDKNNLTYSFDLRHDMFSFSHEKIQVRDGQKAFFTPVIGEDEMNSARNISILPRYISDHYPPTF